jgi:hypothetical protein
LLVMRRCVGGGKRANAILQKQSIPPPFSNRLLRTSAVACLLLASSCPMMGASSLGAPAMRDVLKD